MLRKTTSLTALLSFILLIPTCIVLYIVPHGRRSGQWELWNLDKREWQALHTNLGLLLLVACIIHIALNIKPLMCYLMNKQRKLRVFTPSFTIAALVAAWIVASTLLSLPPVNLIQKCRNTMKHPMEGRRQAETPAPEQKTLPNRPPFRFGSRALSGFCDEYAIDATTLVQDMENIGIRANPAWSMKRIARENDMEPHGLYDVVRQLSPKR